MVEAWLLCYSCYFLLYVSFPLLRYLKNSYNEKSLLWVQLHLAEATAAAWPFLLLCFLFFLKYLKVLPKNRKVL